VDFPSIFVSDFQKPVRNQARNAAPAGCQWHVISLSCHTQ